MKARNIWLVFKDQLPLKRMWRNICNGNIRGILHKRSHFRHEGGSKVTYNTKATARKSADAMSKKTGFRFDPYKCLWCDGYHIGKHHTQNPIHSVVAPM